MPKGNRTKVAELSTRTLLPPGYVRKEVALKQLGFTKLLANLGSGSQRAGLFVHDGPSPFCLPIPQAHWLSNMGSISLSWGSASDQPIQFELGSLFSAIDAEAERRFPNDAASRTRVIAQYRTRIRQTPLAKPLAPKVVTLSTRHDPDWPIERPGCVTISGLVLIETARARGRAPSTDWRLADAFCVEHKAELIEIEKRDGVRSASVRFVEKNYFEANGLPAPSERQIREHITLVLGF